LNIKNVYIILTSGGARIPLFRLEIEICNTLSFIKTLPLMHQFSIPFYSICCALFNFTLAVNNSDVVDRLEFRVLVEQIIVFEVLNGDEYNCSG
jgi:hypothetical protein